MRLAYSAQAASAQAGSLAATARTRSLGTRGPRLRGGSLLLGWFLLRRSGLLPHFLAAPDLFQVVEAANRRVHEVDDDLAEIDQHPLAALLALDAVDLAAALLHLVAHMVGERLDLPRRVAARDHHPLEHRRQARGIEDDDIAPFYVLERFHHDLLLAADVHQ